MLFAAITLESIRRDLQDPLVLFGFAGQTIFFMRFFVQWLASERSGRSQIPIAFWYLSIVGGLMTLVYAYKKSDIVFTFAQAMGLLIYVRNLMLIYSRRQRAAGHREQRAVREPAPQSS
ncbi:MAG: lipid-A-disaccharide synthase N-terminal domain-containing protein [Phycisphaerales bacterium]|nr:lipid-A-disaccharide synthase N-terminal domain-containing protein [Phycisphaerales bacterium]